MQNQDEIELRWILAVIRRWWWLVLICTLLAGGTAYAVISSLPPTYEATATLLVSPGQDTRTNEYNTLVAGERLALTYIEMLKSQTILDAVIAQLGLQVSAEDLAKKVQAITVKDTQLIRLTVESASPTEAARLANTIAQVFTTHIQKLQAERYALSLASFARDMDAMNTVIEATQAQIDSLNAARIQDEARLADLEKQLADQRSDYRTLERDYQDLQLTISQLTDIINVVEPAQAPGRNAAVPYQATTVLLVGRASTSGSVDANQQLIETYSEMLLGRPVLEAAIARLGLEENVEALLTKVSVYPVKDTQLIRLNVVDKDTTRAALIANTIAEIFTGRVKSLLEQPYTVRLADMQKQLAGLTVQIAATQAEIAALTTSKGQVETELARQQMLLADQRSDYQALQLDYRQLTLAAADAAEVVSISEPAQVPDRLADSNGLLYTIIAAIAGAMLALGFAFLFEYLNDTLRETADVNRLLGLAVLGVIGKVPRNEPGSVVVSQPLSPEAEDFRVLAASLRFAGLDHPLHTLMITSPNTEEGKSVIVANLAAALALTELRVLVVDADLRRPQQHTLFGFEQESGLANALLDGTMDGRLKPAQPSGLQVLTSGDPPSNPGEVLGSRRMRELLDELRRQADMVLIDCPPVLPVADAALLAPHVDGVLLILRANRTRGQAAIEAVENLRKVGANIVGVVLNAAVRSKKGYYYYHPAESKNGKGDPAKDLMAALTPLPGETGGKG